MGMRFVLMALMGLICIADAEARDGKTPARRFGIDADLKTYPQAKPRETLASVLKAIDAKRIDYLLAQLADPTWVEKRVQRYGGKFAVLVEETTAKLVGDPQPAKQLHRLLDEGEWSIGDAEASVRLKGSEQVVFLHKAGGRWFMENRMRLK
jgi:hypothetical protein